MALVPSTWRDNVSMDAAKPQRASWWKAPRSQGSLSEERAARLAALRMERERIARAH